MNWINKGHTILRLEFPSSWNHALMKENYEGLYQLAQEGIKEKGILYQHLHPLCLEAYGKGWTDSELMLSKREGPQDEEHEGIWHDDSSRHLAFSLSLTLNPETVKGGQLFIRKRGSPELLAKIVTQPFGHMVVFLTGQKDFEHKISRVTSGNRFVLVGWLSLS